MNKEERDRRRKAWIDAREKMIMSVIETNRKQSRKEIERRNALRDQEQKLVGRVARFSGWGLNFAISYDKKTAFFKTRKSSSHGVSQAHPKMHEVVGKIVDIDLKSNVAKIEIYWTNIEAYRQEEMSVETLQFMFSSYKLLTDREALAYAI